MTVIREAMHLDDVSQRLLSVVDADLMAVIDASILAYWQSKADSSLELGKVPTVAATLAAYLGRVAALLGANTESALLISSVLSTIMADVIRAKAERENGSGAAR